MALRPSPSKVVGPFAATVRSRNYDPKAATNLNYTAS